MKIYNTCRHVNLIEGKYPELWMEAEVLQIARINPSRGKTEVFWIGLKSVNFWEINKSDLINLPKKCFTAKENKLYRENLFM